MSACEGPSRSKHTHKKSGAETPLFKLLNETARLRAVGLIVVVVDEEVDARAEQHDRKDEEEA